MGKDALVYWRFLPERFCPKKSSKWEFSTATIDIISSRISTLEFTAIIDTLSSRDYNEMPRQSGTV